MLGCIAALIFVVAPALAVAEPAIGNDRDGAESGKVQLMPHGFSTAGGDGLLVAASHSVADGQSSRAEADVATELEPLDADQFDEFVVSLNSLDPVLFELTVELGAPLYTGTELGQLLASVMAGNDGDDLEMDPYRRVQFYDRTLERELDISRVVDGQTPAEPVVVQVLNIEF